MREIGIKELLKKGAFFADKENGLPHFCVEPEDRHDFWNNLTKHGATKSISQALNTIMLGRSFDEAMERFMRNISEKISKDEQEKLKDFVLKTEDILKEFYELRQKDISEFVKAKNSLLSIIYLFTKYSNLKEVIKDE